MRVAQGVRPLASIAVGASACALLARAGAPWPGALAAGAAATVFALWRTVVGASVGGALVAVAATSAWSGGAHVSGILPLLPWIGGLEVLGAATILAVARARDLRRISRRLLGAWLASSGMVWLGASLCAGGAPAAGSVLVAAGLAHKLGVVPVFAWVPMLLRHPARSIRLWGIFATACAGTALLRAAAVVPDRMAALHGLTALGAVTLPWAAVRAWTRRKDDPRCAATYAFVTAVSVAVLAATLAGAR